MNKAVKPTKTAPKKPQILIFGAPGVGKTFTALDFPNTFFIDVEGGATGRHYQKKLDESGGMYFGIEQGASDFKTVVDLVAELATTKHTYKTVVIDSISKLFNSEIAKEAERLAKAGLKNEYAADKKPAVALTRRLINWISRMDMNVILISHEKAEYSGGDEIGKTFDAYVKIEYELDLCLQIMKLGGSRKAKVRKSRLEGFPDASLFDWSYKDFAERWGEDIIQSAPQAIELATPEQLATVNGLLENIKLPDGQIEKWFSTAKVESWDEMSGINIELIIENLRKRIK
jgi:hypothetical protein